MNNKWVFVSDDNLRLIDKAVNFLVNEFSDIEADPIWSVEYFKWKIGPTNPAGVGFVSLALIDNQVVGIVTLTRKRLLVNGRYIQGGEVGDSYTSLFARKNAAPETLSLVNSDPSSYKNKSIFGRLASETRARAESNGVRIIYGTPNSNAYPGWIKRLGFFDFKEYKNYSYSRPTWRMIIKRYPRLSMVKGLMHFFENTLISSHAIFIKLKNSNLVFKHHTPSKTEIEQLWHRIKPERGFSLVRDGEYWQHRYIEYPLSKYDLFSIYCKNVLVGLASIRLKLVSSNKRVLFITEWMSEKKVSFDYILTNILCYCKDWSVDVFSIYVRSSSYEAKVSRRCLFFWKNRIPIIISDTAEGIEMGGISENIYFYLGNTDAA